jgi:hypothetical protein
VVYEFIVTRDRRLDGYGLGGVDGNPIGVVERDIAVDKAVQEGDAAGSIEFQVVDVHEAGVGRAGRQEAAAVPAHALGVEK